MTKNVTISFSCQHSTRLVSRYAVLSSVKYRIITSSPAPQNKQTEGGSAPQRAFSKDNRTFCKPGRGLQTHTTTTHAELQAIPAADSVAGWRWRWTSRRRRGSHWHLVGAPLPRLLNNKLSLRFHHDVIDPSTGGVIKSGHGHGHTRAAWRAGIHRRCHHKHLRGRRCTSKFALGNHDHVCVGIRSGGAELALALCEQAGLARAPGV